MSTKKLPIALALFLGLVVTTGCPGKTSVNPTGGATGGATGVGEKEIDPFIANLVDLEGVEAYKKKQLEELAELLDSDLKSKTFRALNIIGEYGLKAGHLVPKIKKFVRPENADEQTRNQAIRALGRIPTEESRIALLEVLVSSDRVRGELAADGLAAHGDSIVESVTPLLENEDPRIRALAVRALHGVVHKKGLHADLGDSVLPLAKLLDDPDRDVADWAMRVVLELGDRAAPAVGHLEARLAAEPKPGTRAQIALVIGLVGPAAAEAAQTIRESGAEGRFDLEAVIGVSLVRLGFVDEGLDRMGEALRLGDDNVKVLTAGYLRGLGPVALPMVNQLQDMLGDSSDGVRNMVEMALREIRKEDA